MIEKVGAGGMGEVYRAQDTRLGRDVAIKVLSPHLAATPEVRARFEREARTISQLNHPHICTLYDVGHQDGMDYLVMELLEGETLAQRLEKGALPVTEVLALGAQIAEALDRAHSAGVVHRDLKPGNVMLTKSGAKLMDFGLARAARPAAMAGAAEDLATLSRPVTAEGTLVGTVPYMAPEQLEGKEADARTDLWALGCVLYEMATGARAFAGDSQASLIAAILKETPRQMTELRPLTPPVLEHVVTRCLAKDPAERWQSARDAAHELEWARSASGTAAGVAVAGAPTKARLALARLATGIAVGALVIAALWIAFAWRAHPVDPARTTYTRLTLQRGFVTQARFSPDGETVLYSAAWDGRPPEIFETRPDFPTSRALGLQEANLLAVSSDGTMAVLLGQRSLAWWLPGTLATVPVSGGAPRHVLDDAQAADWTPDGKTLAIVRRVGSMARLEMPPGHVIHETTGNIAYPRVSRDGKHVAFIANPFIVDTRGSIVVTDTAGRIVVRAPEEWNDPKGLAWSADGRELWFCGSQNLVSTDLVAMSLNGRQRVVARFAGMVSLCDIGRNGRLLLRPESYVSGIRGRSSPAGAELELGWFDAPSVLDISADGRSLLFSEQGAFGGPQYALCLRGMDGSPPVKLGEAGIGSLSPDGRWAAAIHFGPPQRLLLLPTGSGDTTSLSRGQIEAYQSVDWFPDGTHVVFVGSEPGRDRRTYLQDLLGGLPQPLTEEGIAGTEVSPDGRFVLATSGDGRLFVCPLNGDSARYVTRLMPGEGQPQWAADGNSAYLGTVGTSMRVSRIDLATGQRTPWKTFSMPDSTGVFAFRVCLTPDGRGYACSYARYLSDLYLVDGLE
ncbi:MAG: protein kinase [bacterium]